MNVAFFCAFFASANLDAAKSREPKRSELLIASACEEAVEEAVGAAEAFVAFVAFVCVMLYRADAGGSIGWEMGSGGTK